MAKQKTEAELTRELKAYAQKVASEVSERLLKGDKKRGISHKRNRRIDTGLIEQSYNQLDGEWRDWLEVARRYERKVPLQDRPDTRHNIMVELHRATNRDGKPLPILRAYRIASLTVALYWREQNKLQVKVCVLYGRPRIPDHKCSFVGKPSKCRECPFLAVRPIQSLDSEVIDGEGNTVRLLDTVASDKAIDLPDVYYDLKTWLLGCPMRLVEIANKKLDGKPLSVNERKYLSRHRQKEQKSLF